MSNLIHKFFFIFSLNSCGLNLDRLIIRAAPLHLIHFLYEILLSKLSVYPSNFPSLESSPIQSQTKILQKLPKIYKSHQNNAAIQNFNV